jgi:hypothetical protein
MQKWSELEDVNADATTRNIKKCALRSAKHFEASHNQHHH